MSFERYAILVEIHLKFVVSWTAAKLPSFDDYWYRTIGLAWIFRTYQILFLLSPGLILKQIESVPSSCNWRRNNSDETTIFEIPWISYLENPWNLCSFGSWRLHDEVPLNRVKGSLAKQVKIWKWSHRSTESFWHVGRVQLAFYQKVEYHWSFSRTPCENQHIQIQRNLGLHRYHHPHHEYREPHHYRCQSLCDSWFPLGHLLHWLRFHQFHSQKRILSHLVYQKIQWKN